MYSTSHFLFKVFSVFEYRLWTVETPPPTALHASKNNGNRHHIKESLRLIATGGS